MNYKVFPPGTVSYIVELPASKSISNRALILNSLCGSVSSIENVAKCDDTDAMVAALVSKDSNVNIGAAGTAMRFLTAYFAMKMDSNIVIDGSTRMRQRPIKVLVDALRLCGANITYLQNEGFSPLSIRGAALSAQGISLPGDISSQYISAILMIAPCMEGGLTINLTGKVISLPYIEMTLSLMQQFGVNCTLKDNIITIPQAEYSSPRFCVESDWSAASYWYQLQSLLPQSTITLRGLHENSVQGDSAVKEYFAMLGVKTTFCKDGVILSTDNCYKSIDLLNISLVNQPDLAQTIITTACLKDIPFHISGLSTLKIKETDRIEALRSELFKLGYIITVHDDYSISWNGEKNEIQEEEEIIISTFDDHRMAMAFAPAAIIHQGITIANIEVVSKSYPQYWEHLKSVGFNFEEA